LKQIAQYQDGRIELQEVPIPVPPPGGILVRNTHSVISVGTERMKVEQAQMNLYQKAKARPDQVRKVLDTARNLGWRAALEKVRNRLDFPTPLGYSAAGLVEAVDPANTRFRVGDRVACGGAECAFHAEYIAVPDFLAAKIPPGVEDWRGAYTTLVSIALHAVRQLEPSLGERVLVLGQGLVGLLITSVLRASGVRVLAADIAEARRPFAVAMGAERVLNINQQSLSDEVRAWTEGFGVDAAILATATASNTPVEQAVEALRERGRIVVVGNTKVDLLWRYAYDKEIELRYSRSYGPGRYDPAYELGGSDYPIGYVRWTEQRNFDACLHLIQSGAIDLSALTTRRVPFADALNVYRELLEDSSKDVGVLLDYPTPETPASKVQMPSPPRTQPKSAVAPPAPLRLSQPVSRVDVIGAGNFARTMLLPHLQGRLPFGTVINATALSAQHAKTKFGFAEAGTDAPKLLASPSTSPAAVLIATRHHLHAPLLLQALAADRHTFIEKPLCLTRAELTQIDLAVTKTRGSVQVGFNRRFAGASTELRQLLRAVPGPKTCSYRVFAGKLDPTTWYANYAESGGRILGEACHFLDYFCFLFDSAPVRVLAQTNWPASGRLPFPDSVTAQVEFADGSSGQLIYSAEGDPGWPKEQCTVFGAGIAAELTNFQELVVRRGRRKTTRSFTSKGHPEQMAAWAEFLKGVAPHPFPYPEARRSMLLTFATLESIQEARAVEIDAAPA